MVSTSRRGGEVEVSLRACLRRLGVRRGARVLVAVSGGPDSTAMLHALHHLPDSQHLEVVGAYLDHGLREAAERARERRLIAGLCATLELPLVSERVSPGNLQRRARRARRSLEEAARSLRYAFLQRAAVQMDCTLIAVGHTADDQAETLLMRLLQGAGVEALRGIPEKRGKIIRPLLHCSRAAVLRYLRRHDLPSHRDSSNSSTRFLRNALRLRLVPLLEELLPGFRAGLARLAGQFEQVRMLLEEQARIRLPWRATDRGFVLGVEQFAAAPPVLRAMSLRLQMQELGLASRQVPQRFLAQAAEAPRVPEAAILLAGYGLRLLHQGESLVLRRDIVWSGEKGYFIAGRRGGRLVVPTAGLEFEFGDPSGAGRRLLVRSHRPGDIIRVARGAKSVDKILSEWRIPPGERWKVPVVEDECGIVAVMARALGFDDRFRGDAPEHVGLSVWPQAAAYAGERE
jgi:tRNA(Ile)-lysidine synthase